MGKNKDTGCCGCSKVCLNLVTIGCAVVSVALLAAAAINSQWFGTDQRRANNNDIHVTINQNDVLSASVELKATLAPIGSEFFASLRIVTTSGRQDSIFIKYIGPLWQICDDVVVQDLAKDACKYVEYGGIVLLTLVIVSLVGLGLLAIFAVVQVVAGKSAHNPCCSFIMGLFAFLGFFCSLLVGGIWGGLGTYGKDEINKRVPEIINKQISGLGYTGSAPSDSGKFTAEISLWIAVASVPFALFAWIFNMVACCCVRRRPKKSKDEDNYNRPPGSLPRHSTGPSFSSSDKAGTEMYQPKAFS